MLFKKVKYRFNEHLNFGDKSITHRAFICGALADGKTEIENACICRDTLATADCLQKMGARFEFRGTSVTVYPMKNIPAAKEPLSLFCGNSGTTARLLAGVAAGLGVRAVFSGDESLSRRPMDRVILPLRRMGLGIDKKEGALFETCGKKSAEDNDGEFVFETTSAQVKSALLFAALTSGKRIKIIEEIKSRDHTEIMLSCLGARLTTDGKQITLDKSRISSGKIKIPNDASAAAFFVAHGLMGEGVVLHGVGLNPTRTEYLSLLKESGADITTQNVKRVCGELQGDIVVKKSALKPFFCPPERAALLLDEIPALAVLALTVKGKSVFEGVSELCKKESDRLLGLRILAEKLGSRSVDCGGDRLEIDGAGFISGGKVDTLGDHRLQFAAAIAGLHAKDGVETDFDFADVSCPDFLKILGVEKFRFGLLGSDIAASRSPVLFSMFSKYFSTPCSYGLFQTDEARFAETVEYLKKNADGFNVTMPFKRMLTADGFSCNAVSVKCGRFFPASTDGDGVMMSLEKRGICVDGKKLLIVGAGGSAFAAARSLAQNGAKLYFANRTEEKACGLARFFDAKTHKKGIDYYGILSFVPVWDKMLFAEESDVEKAEFVFDAYYFHDTRLLQCARETGKIAIGGLNMLFFQAIRAFEIFTSVKASPADIDELYKLFGSMI